MEQTLRELADLDRHLGETRYSAPLFEVPQRRRRPRRRRRLLPLLITVALAFVAVRAVGTDPVGGGLVFDDGLDGESGSGGPGYSFARLQPDRVSPATWPCEGPIPIEVNPAGAPSDYESLIADAVTGINEASGFSFEVVGETSDRDFLDRGAGPVLVGFADETEIDLLAADAAGIGGSTYVAQTPGGRFTAVGGLVALDTEVFTDDLPQEYGTAILLHELAHVLGLGHTDSPGELMRSTGSAQTGFGPGDLAGLGHLREAACA